VQHRVEPQDALNDLREVLVNIKYPRYQDQGPCQNIPDRLPDREAQEHEAIEGAKPNPQQDTQHESFKHRCRVDVLPYVLRDEYAAKDDHAHHGLRQNRKQAPRQKRVKVRHTRIGHKRTVERDGGTHVSSDALKEPERQDAPGIKQEEIRPKRRRAQQKREPERQHHDGGDRFEDGPDITTR